MRILAVALVVGALLACGQAPPPEPAAPPPLDAHAAALAVGERVGRELDCAGSVARYLCGLRLLPGDGFELPAAPTTWVGITVAIRRSRTIEDGALETASLSQLTMGPGGVWLTSMRPSNSFESMTMGRVLTNASMAAKGSAASIEVPRDLLDYLRGGGDSPTLWPATRDGNGWAFQGAHPGRVYRVPAEDLRPPALVVVETTEHGDFVSVFPDVPLEAPEEDMVGPVDPVGVQDPPPPPAP